MREDLVIQERYIENVVTCEYTNKESRIFVLRENWVEDGDWRRDKVKNLGEVSMEGKRWFRREQFKRLLEVDDSILTLKSQE